MTVRAKEEVGKRAGIAAIKWTRAVAGMGGAVHAIQGPHGEGGETNAAIETAACSAPCLDIAPSDMRSLAGLLWLAGRRSLAAGRCALHSASSARPARRQQ